MDFKFSSHALLHCSARVPAAGATVRTVALTGQQVPGLPNGVTFGKFRRRGAGPRRPHCISFHLNGRRRGWLTNDRAICPEQPTVASA